MDFRGLQRALRGRNDTGHGCCPGSDSEASTPRVSGDMGASACWSVATGVLGSGIRDSLCTGGGAGDAARSGEVSAPGERKSGVAFPGGVSSAGIMGLKNSGSDSTTLTSVGHPSVREGRCVVNTEASTTSFSSKALDDTPGSFMKVGDAKARSLRLSGPPLSMCVLSCSESPASAPFAWAPTEGEENIVVHARGAGVLGS